MSKYICILFLLLFGSISNISGYDSMVNCADYNVVSGNMEYPIDYQPLLEDGKQWKVVHGIVNSHNKYITHQIINVFVAGDTIIENTNCKKLLVNCEYIDYDSDLCEYASSCYNCQNINSGESIICLNERFRKIYLYREPGLYYDSDLDEFGAVHTIIRKGDPYWDLYMSSDYKEGDKYISASENINGFGTVIDETYLEYGGLLCRTLSFSNDAKWIEGIGSPSVYCMMDPFKDPEEPVSTCALGHFTLMVSCRIDDTILYDMTDYCNAKNIFVGGTSLLSTPSYSNTLHSNDYFDVRGYKIKNPAPGSLLIHNGELILYK